MTSLIPQGLHYGLLEFTAYDYLTSCLSEMCKCGHVDFSEIEWCVSCKARHLLKIIVESY